MSGTTTHRILVVDDSDAIHRDFAKILATPAAATDLATAATALFGGSVRPPQVPTYDLEFASQGEEALALVRRAKREGRPFSLAFVDMRMPPGWDGMRTIQELWRELDGLHTVICTAYSDIALADVSARLGRPDRLLVLKKPFDAVEVQQLAASLCEKSRLATELQRQLLELQRARAAAETASEAKSAFLANMSHEIRTPLTAMLGYAGILREEALPRAEQLEHLDTICSSGEHLVRVLSDILDMAKIEADRVEFERVPFSPVQSLRQARNVLRGAAANKGLRSDLVLSGDFPDRLLGDPTRLHQILLNLIGNAIKFTSTGHVSMRAHIQKSDPLLVDLHIDVEDSGIGIPAERLPELFSSFTQADVSMTRRFGGSGLGLAIARRLARGMGGDIKVRSDEGRGSCFSVSVALTVPEDAKWSDPAVETVTPIAKVAATPGPAQAATFAGRVLVVDDSPDNRRLVTHHLKRAGATVTVAGDGSEALRLVHDAAAAGTPFDLVVTDVQMPELDGCSFTRILRSERNRVPIVALTANTQSEDRQAVFDAGCDSCLTKPLDRRELLETCARLLHSPRQGG
jgi:two-component system sensor histidine kinase/response regulator